MSQGIVEYITQNYQVLNNNNKTKIEIEGVSYTKTEFFDFNDNLKDPKILKALNQITTNTERRSFCNKLFNALQEVCKLDAGIATAPPEIQQTSRNPDDYYVIITEQGNEHVCRNGHGLNGRVDAKAYYKKIGRGRAEKARMSAIYCEERFTPSVNELIYTNPDNPDGPKILNTCVKPSWHYPVGVPPKITEIPFFLKTILSVLLADTSEAHNGVLTWMKNMTEAKPRNLSGLCLFGMNGIFKSVYGHYCKHYMGQQYFVQPTVAVLQDKFTSMFKDKLVCVFEELKIKNEDQNARYKALFNNTFNPEGKGTNMEGEYYNHMNIIMTNNHHYNQYVERFERQKFIPDLGEIPAIHKLGVDLDGRVGDFVYGNTPEIEALRKEEYTQLFNFLYHFENTINIALENKNENFFRGVIHSLKPWQKRLRHLIQSGKIPPEGENFDDISWGKAMQQGIKYAVPESVDDVENWFMVWKEKDGSKLASVKPVENEDGEIDYYIVPYEKTRG